MGNNNVTLKYTRKMPRGEIERMKLVKTPRFKILSQVDEGVKRIFRIVL
jgi:hypothetical protein